MVKARSDQTSEPFSLWKIVQKCSNFRQKLWFFMVFLSSYMPAIFEAKSDQFQSLLAHEKLLQLSLQFLKVFLASYMSAMVEARWDQISESFSLWKFKWCIWKRKRKVSGKNVCLFFFKWMESGLLSKFKFFFQLPPGPSLPLFSGILRFLHSL